jgi:hypothetical protein
MSLGFTRAALSAPQAPKAALAFSADFIGSGILGKSQVGQVFAVFERACVVALQGGQMIALLTRSVGNVAHGVRLNCNPRLDRIIQIGVSTRLTRQEFVIGRVAVLLSNARVWSTNLRPGMGREPKTRIAALLARRLLHERNTCRSELLASVLRLDQPTSALSGRIAATLPQLARATLRLDHETALVSLSKLIGLGPGLTPAGDDFIIGWLAGVMLMAGTPAELEFLNMVGSGLLSLSDGTTPISRQHLRDATAGEFSELLSDVCFALVSGAPGAELGATLSRQLSVGATSGADAAAGLIFALLDCSSLFGRPDHRPLLGECDGYPPQNRSS